MNKKVYTDDVVSKLQEAININGVKLDQCQSWDNMPKAVMLYESKYVLEPNHTITAYYSDNITKENIDILRNSSLRKYYCKDWRKEESVENYYELHVVVGEINVTVLAKKIDAVLEDDEYGSYLNVNDEDYIIIKCILDDYEHYYTASELEEKPELIVHDSYGNVIVKGGVVINKVDKSEDKNSSKISDGEMADTEFVDSVELF